METEEERRRRETFAGAHMKGLEGIRVPSAYKRALDLGQAQTPTPLIIQLDKDKPSEEPPSSDSKKD